LIRHTLFALATKKKAFFLGVVIFTLFHACIDKKKEGTATGKRRTTSEKYKGVTTVYRLI
jgi:hypothetical protein